MAAADIAEDFGQRVDLTSRIREILANYPEGTTVLKELIQNADDAGATEVRFCLDRRQHGTDSLLYPDLSAWQGPALLAQNNAQFSDRDFESISKLGGSQKQSEPWKTGRFGVGFNSVYHLSDLPSFVSGKHIVFFDPHCKFLPNISAVNPGKRVDFVSSGALRQYKDQFSPYCVFGCDMTTIYEGTIFRFPLRTATQAAESQLSKQFYSEDDVVRLLDELHVEASMCMLFLKNIVMIKIYDWNPTSKHPCLLFSCSIESLTDSVCWYRHGLPRLSKSWASIHGTPVPKQLDSFSLSFVTRRYSGAETVDMKVESFVIVQCLEASTSRIGALSSMIAEKHGARLLPWGAVAANISEHARKGNDQGMNDGRAFCFLPLPVKTNFPVHINGFFELSSNRRDLWYGADMEGLGKIRSEWNDLLLKDVVAPSYCHLLSIVPEVNRFQYSFWPCGTFVDPWKSMVGQFYKNVAECSLLHSHVNGGTWVTPMQALFFDEYYTNAEELGMALVKVGLPVVHLPKTLREMFSHYCNCTIVCPNLVRHHLKQAGINGHHIVRTVGLTLLEYCLDDVIDEEAADYLLDLPLIPLANGEFGVFQKRMKNSSYFFCSDKQLILMERVKHKLIAQEIGNVLQKRLYQIAQFSTSNVCLLTATEFVYLLPQILPAEWKNKDEVEWRPNSVESHPSDMFMSSFWAFLRESCDDLHLFERWPILPTTGGLLCTAKRTSKIIKGGLLPKNLETILTSIGCHVLRPDLDIEHPALSKYVNPPTGIGILATFSAIALSNRYTYEKMFSAVSNSQRCDLRAFLLDHKWYKEKQMLEDQLMILKSLPLFEVYRNAGCMERVFTDLVSTKKYLPPPDVDESLLGPEFLYIQSEQEIDVMIGVLMVEQMTRPFFFKSRVISCFDELTSNVRNQAVLTILKELPILTVQDSSFKDVLTKLAFVPSSGGELKAPRSLYDPRIQEFKILLDEESAFPSIEFRKDEILDALRLLGLQTVVSPVTVLQSAHQAAKLLKENPEEATARGSLLLSYLEENALKLFPSAAVDGINKVLLKVTDIFYHQRMDSVASKRFWSELASVCWCPVLVQSPHSGLPWPAVTTPLAPPRLVRLPSELWLASASLRILNRECHSVFLSQKLGWIGSLGGNVLAAQLLELGKNYVNNQGLSQSLATIIPKIYALLTAKIGTDELEIVKAMLDGSCWIWVGDRFVSTEHAVLNGPLHLAPYVWVIPADLAVFKELLTELGVRESLTIPDFADILFRMRKTKNGSQLDSQELKTVIWILQHLTDSGFDGVNISLCVPDIHGILQSSTDLVYDDAPWLLAEPTHDILPFNMVSLRKQFVHANISNEVADKLGVKSLRRLLLAQSSDSLNVTLHGVAEAFGQHEALTTRLKHIVEMYADGPGILCELLQNSDDAGATEVSFLLDKNQFGSSSVLSPKMSDWQGPALYCFNDSVFTTSDLHAISRIGQDNKFQKPHTVGRFGLGFNSVYHFTDVPGFVSGETLVMFDPHATYLPGISPSHPGLKINFVGRGIALQFPDQCRPFMLFGCDLQKPYHGTLFRFPLRTAATASHSLIKQEVYSPDMILSLFEKFQALASEVLLFLHNVNSITVYIREGLDQDLHMLYCVKRHHGGKKSVYNFVSGVENQESGKDYFYKRLQKTPKNLLPSDCQKIEITLQDNKSLKTQFWMVSDCLGGERAIEMAVTQENRVHGFVPWAGIAAKLGEKDENTMDGTVKEHKKLEGRAFCFLPLPVYTGLPIHVNGYFELSSNRRDIWYGDDMAGGGKLRSEWNSCLLEEVASFAYVHLLANAASHLGPCEKYFSLWPTVLAPEPWLTLLRGFYQSASELDLPVLYTFARGGQWISAKKAVFPDYSYSDVVELGNALTDAGLMLVNAPKSVVDKFKEFCPTLKYLTPQMLRNSLVRRQRALNSRSAMLACLKYSLCDVERKEAAEKLQGLPLIPLATGMFGTFGNITAKETFFLANEAEYSLLKDTLAEKLVDRSINFDLFKQLETLSQTKSINVVCISPDILKDLLPKILPAGWHGQRIIRWMPSQAGHPSHEWMELLWRVLSSACMDLSYFFEWPLLPTSDGHLLQLKRGSNVLQGDRWSENMVSLLQKMNCFMVISTFAINHPQLEDYVHNATASGLLEALLAAAGGYKQLKDLFKEVSESEYQELRGFLLQRKWFSSDQLTAVHIEVLKRLPIFKTYGNSIRVSLVTPTRFFPPEDVEAELLDDNFIQAESDKERAILSEFLGVTQVGKHDFYEKHAFRRLDSIPSHVLTRIIPNLLLNFSVLEKDVPSIKEILSGLSIIGTKKGALKSPKELYDPRVEELKLLLDRESFFPAEDFTADAILDVLVQLGLKRSLGVSGLLDSALSIATLSSLDEAGAFEMGKRLLAYMNDLGLELDQSNGVMRSDSLLLLSAADQNKEEDQAESSFSGPCEVSGQESGPSDRTITDNDEKFWMELASISWCPALINPPIPELPWPKGLKTLLAPPKIVRPKSQMWHVSASMRILDDDLNSALIMSRLGWLEKPNLSILAMQLIEISETHKQLLSECSSGSVTEGTTEGFKNTLQEVIPSLYSLMESSMNPENVINLQSMLEGSPWVWVGDEFVHSAEAVFDSPVHFKPYLQKVPSELCGFKEFFSALGVKETCGVMDFIHILQRLSADMKGKALSTEHLNFAVRLLEAIDDCILLGNISLSEGLLGAILVPDANGILTPAKDLIYNDAPWIAKSMPEFAETKHFVHGNVRNELADRLGAKSLRYLSFVDKEMTNDLPCLAAEDISNILANCGDRELLLFDILEVANKCKAQRVHLVYDKRLHPQTSILQPNLGQLQGPALTVVLEGVELTMEEICNLQMSPSGRTQGQSSNYGGGLLSCYNITDFLLMVTSGSLYLFDPSGSYLAPSLANLKLPSTRLPQGKAYKLQGTDIAQRFADQFLPLTLTRDLSWAKLNTTMIRMPVSINSNTFTKGSSMSSEELLECSFKIFMNHASTALLFLDSVEAVHLSKWEAGSVALQEFFSVKVDPACVSLRNPFVGKSWKKFQISNIFNSSTNSTKMNTIDIFISDHGNYVMDKWLVVLSFGFGQTRNLAVDRKFLSYSLSPVAGVAVHVSQNGAIPSGSLNSSILAPFPLSFSFRLPVHILGCFLVSHEGFRHLFPSSSMENFETRTVSSSGLQQASLPLHSMWNQELIVCVCEAYLQLLREAVRVRQVSYPKGNHFLSSHISRGTWKILAEQYYSLWPIAENLIQTPLNYEGNGGGLERKLLVDLLVRPMFVRLADLPLWELQGGGLAKATEGIFLYHPNAEKKQLLPPAAVCDYLKEQYRVFVVPCEFTKELEDAGVSIKTITPRMVRALLSSAFSTPKTLSLEWHLELLEYCCSDFEIVNQWSDGDFPSSEMSNGLPTQEEEDRSSPSQGASRELSTSLRNRSSLVSQDPGGDALGVVGNIGRAIVQFGKGVVEDLSTELSQKNTQPGHLLGSHEVESSGNAFEKWVSEVKGLPCPTATSGIIRLGMAQIWLGSSEQQKLMLPLASRFMHSSCLERPLLLKIFTNKVLQQKLQIKPFVAQLLSDNLKLILPKDWVKSIGPAPWVAWNYLTESRVLSPSPEWLRMFWKNVETSTDDLSHFQQWPLIPAVLDDTLLTKIQHKDLVFIPPRLESAEVFDVGHGIVHTDQIVLDVSDYCQNSFKEIQESYPWVFSVLKKCCIPIFDQNFLDCKVVEVCVPASGQSLGQVIRSKLLTALRAGVFVASNLSLLPSDCDALFSLFALDFHSSSGETLNISADLTILRSLPIYKTTTGAYTSVDPSSHCIVTPEAFFQPQNDFCLQYYPPGMGGLLYRSLGIPELSNSELLLRFCIPGFDNKSVSDQESILHYLYANWDSLQTDDTVVGALADMKFVSSGDNAFRDLFRPRELLDPNVALFRYVYKNRTARFPSARYSSDKWLDILRKTGLQCVVDAKILLECAREVEGIAMNKSADTSETYLILGDTLEDVLLTASMVVEAVLENFASVYGNSFCQQLSEIAFIPAEIGLPIENGTPSRKVLTSYKQAVLMKDWPLAWTCSPLITKTNFVPPEFSWPSLQLRSPPRFETVLRHLQIAGAHDGEDIMARWPSVDGRMSVEDAFLEVLEYLNHTWGNLSSSDKRMLEKVHFIPVSNGTRLCPANRIFVRLEMNLAPFIFQIPSSYLSFVNILSELGMQESPSFESMQKLLLEMQDACGYQRLNPNELRAVFEILNFLSEWDHQSRRLTDRAVVPDDAGRLLSAGACVYIDAAGSAMISKIDTSRLRFVHPHLSEHLCIRLGVHKLSEVVEEALDEDTPLEYINQLGGVSKESIIEKLQCECFQQAVWNLVRDFSVEISSLTSWSKLDVVRELVLAAENLKYAKVLYTRFIKIQGNVDITLKHYNEDGRHRVYEYVSKKTGNILVAEPPNFISLPELLSVVISKLLGSPVCLPLSCLLSVPIGSEMDAARLLQLRTHLQADNRGRVDLVTPGSELSVYDATRVQIHPLRPYYAGEIVAWSSDFAPDTKLWYGRVVEDVRATAGQALYPIQVETYPRQIQMLLSSNVFSFRSVSLEKPSERAPDQLSVTLFDPILSKVQETSMRNKMSSSSEQNVETNHKSFSKNVSADAVVHAINDMLAAVGIPLGLDHQSLLNQSLTLQENLRETNEALSVEKARAETAAKDAETARAAWLCRVCLSLEVNSLLLPCGHVMCRNCCAAVTRCPFCRKPVSKSVPLYRP